MLTFRVGWIDVVCAVVAAVQGAISPYRASRLAPSVALKTSARSGSSSGKAIC